VLYGVRKLLTLWYDYWISKNQVYLEDLNKERDGTIEKLKAATKFNSTQQIIDKYSSKPSTPNKATGEGKKRTPSGKQDALQQRVFMQPPPTANIPRGPSQNPGPPSPQRPPSAAGQLMGLQNSMPPSPGRPSAEFAPNAYSSQAEYSSVPTFGESRWYDRILDALLGEDEASSKNRFALICSQCKLVNGQAPPGAKSLEDVGKWRCSGCGAWNGEESEAEKLVKHVTETANAIEKPVATKFKDEPEEYEEIFAPNAKESGDESSTSGPDVADQEKTPPALSTRSKSKMAKGKKKL